MSNELLQHLIHQLEDGMDSFCVYEHFNMNDNSRFRFHVIMNEAYEKLHEMGYTYKITVEKEK